ncbi:PREDICTED: uncharacterized protein LOC106789841 isoform X1 [Polistes canadensis]|uniref:uncharacterized protein LOC106789841 isoform X1 n=2 Tax=Polistes canadensis TaxID=91411 RepID=UPI000718CF5C|nr:PREDICTED: uncharacterized protein LOC106789841 isoform X1 [Polistes canadensis]
MDKCLKQIMWVSWTLRSRALFLNCNKVKNRIYFNNSQNYWNTSAEIYRSVNLLPVKKIMDESSTLTSNDTKRILDSITNECQNMSLNDVLNVLSIIAGIAKDEDETFHFGDHEGFKLLCNQIQEQIRHMNLRSVIKSLKLLNLLNTPSNTMIMQSLLQVIKSNINQLDINQMHLLAVILKKMEPTPLSSALQIALPMLLPNILTKKFDYSDFKELALALNYLKYVDERYIFIKIYQSIQSALVNDSKSVSVTTLKNIFISLSMLSNEKQISKENKKTISMIREALFQNINKMTPADIEECLKEISRSMIDKEISHSYDTTFINELLNVVISKNLSVNTTYNITRYLNNINFVYLPFIEFLITEILKKEYIEKVDAYSLQEILQILSNAEYHSVPWLILENKLLEDKFLNETPVKVLLKCGVHLAALNKFYPKLLSKIFSETNIKLLSSNIGNNIHSKRLLFLHQSVKSLYPYYFGPWPNSSILKLTLNSLDIKFTNTLRIHVEKTMGGPGYVASNLKTKLGHNIHHAIILRKGGYPTAFNVNNPKPFSNFNYYVEDLQYEPNLIIVLIVAYPSQSYAINTQELLGVWKSQIICIEKWTGYKCIAININKWINLLPHEKSKSIMQKIKDKCSDIFEIT